MSFTSNEKSYGGYSSFSPVRHAEKSGEKKEKNENIPNYVHDKVEEIMGNQKEKDEGKAWAVAWSIYCKYKKPGSPHCKKESDDYFPSRNSKKATWTKKDQQKIKRITLKISGALDVLSSKALLVVEEILNQHCDTEREKQVVRHMFTKGKFPSYMSKYAEEARILGRIAGKLHYEKKPSSITYDETRKAHKVLRIIAQYCYVKWSSRVWSKVYFSSKDIPLSTIRLEMLRIPQIRLSVEYSRLLRILFP